MGYVMVPVPEEHVEEAMAMILRISAKARVIEWDQQSVDAVFHEVDEPSRSVLSATARSALSGSSISDAAAAETIELTQREVLGIVREINEQARLAERPPIVTIVQEPETLPNGRVREQRKLVMEPEVAAFVREAERAELQAAPHPLLSGQG
jgi:hypothetical protein